MIGLIKEVIFQCMTFKTNCITKCYLQLSYVVLLYLLVQNLYF